MLKMKMRSNACKVVEEGKAQPLQQDMIYQLKQENTRLWQQVVQLQQLLGELMQVAQRQRELLTPVVTPEAGQGAQEGALCVQEVSSQQVRAGSKCRALVFVS